ncbi:MAG TPA: hypothetical protein VEU62_18965 [Bryobacterales bacterium]|nr:hypothetical protein [Bryobacterales bacterium]
MASLSCRSLLPAAGPRCGACAPNKKGRHRILSLRPGWQPLESRSEQASSGAGYTDHNNDGAANSDNGEGWDSGGNRLGGKLRGIEPLGARAARPRDMRRALPGFPDAEFSIQLHPHDPTLSKSTV